MRLPLLLLLALACADAFLFTKKEIDRLDNQDEDWNSDEFVQPSCQGELDNIKDYAAERDAEESPERKKRMTRALNQDKRRWIEEWLNSEQPEGPWTTCAEMITPAHSEQFCREMLVTIREAIREIKNKRPKGLDLRIMQQNIKSKKNKWTSEFRKFSPDLPGENCSEILKDEQFPSL